MLLRSMTLQGPVQLPCLHYTAMCLYWLAFPLPSCCYTFMLGGALDMLL